MQPALGVMRDIRHHTSGSEPGTLEGWEEERCCGQTGNFWFSPWKMCWQKPWVGLMLVCPCNVMATHQGSPLETVSLWSFYIKPTFFLHPAGLVCQGHVPVPLLALPQTCCQGSMSSGGTTVSTMENWAAISPSLLPPKGRLQTFTAR